MKYKVSTNRPGDSLYKQIETLKHDKLDDITTVPLATSLLLLMSILSYLGWFPTHNLAIVIIAFLMWLISIVYTARKLKTWKKDLDGYRQGLDGERYIGAVLERFRVREAEVFHDICFEDKFNIDHLVISRRGIFVIETKNYSTDKGHVVNLEKGRIMITGYDHSEIYKKVDSYATHLASLISELTGKEFPIKKVILFPGWFIEGKCATSDFWVLNEKAFMKFFENANLIYKESDIAALKTQMRYWIVNHTENKPLI
jgi:hypothetical protein